MKAAIIFVFFVSAIFAQTVLNIGGTTCIPDEAESCTAREGSSRVVLVGGVDVSGENECAAGAADSGAVAVPLTIAEDGFFNIAVRGLGAFGAGDVAVLVYEGAEANVEEPCEAVFVTNEAEAGLFWTAGEYTVVVTADNGEADACGEFTLTITQTEYEFQGVTDTEVARIQTFFGCSGSGDNVWAAVAEFTPAEDGAYLFFGVGRVDDTTTTIGVVMVTTDLGDANITSADALCNVSDAIVPFDVAELGYVLTADTTYWVYLYDTAAENQMTEQNIWFNSLMQGGEPAPIPECDNMDYDDQMNYLRPSIPAVSVVDECEEGTSEYYFDVRQTSFETDQFVVVDTVGCGNPDDTRSNVDGAVVLYYGAVGTPRDGDEPAVAPEDVCENFIIAGDSGDGGAVYYWFPAGEDLTIVPTTYSSGASGVYWLTLGGYDIVGCVPANPYLPEPETSVSSSLVVVAFAVVMAALF